jgi:hypothetical protein
VCRELGKHNSQIYTYRDPPVTRTFRPFNAKGIFFFFCGWLVCLFVCFFSCDGCRLGTAAVGYDDEGSGGFVTPRVYRLILASVAGRYRACKAEGVSLLEDPKTILKCDDFSIRCLPVPLHLSARQSRNDTLITVLPKESIISPAEWGTRFYWAIPLCLWVGSKLKYSWPRKSQSKHYH